MRKFRIASGSWRRARLEVGSKVMSWSRNWPRNVKPAEMVALFGFWRLLAGSVTRGPPRAPSSARASRISLVSAANGGRVGNSRPNRPCA
jgi:hypothetical protein